MVSFDEVSMDPTESKSRTGIEAETRTVVLYGEIGNGPQTEVTLFDETMWLTQLQMAKLFGTTVPNIATHLGNIYKEGELTKDSTIKEFLIVREEHGRQVKRGVLFYNLDAIIAVGYRVNSSQATRFRIWATKILKEYIIKGFALDDDRLKQGKKVFGQDYFRELLQRVRAIRTSEAQLWRQLTDIFIACSIDYDKGSPVTRKFFSRVQNLFHYAITGQTAAEIIWSHADHTKPHMGLSTWGDAPEGRIYKSDVMVAKNYLSQDQIRTLERSVGAFFDYIEGKIERHQTFTMESLAEAVIRFLEFNDYEILQGNGQISKKQAVRKAGEEYRIFNPTQKYITDFDRQIEEEAKKHKP
jgi:hypothetical protein